MEQLKNYLNDLKSIIGKELETIEIDRHGIITTYLNPPVWIGSFIQSVHDSSSLDKNYMINMETLTQSKNISLYSYDQLWTLLTYYVRQDRFDEGLLYRSMINGTIHEIVNRICTLNETSSR